MSCHSGRICLAMSALLLAGCEAAAGEDRAGSAPAVLVPAHSAYVATAVGRIDGAGEARQLVALADGAIAGVHVARGDRVRAGQLLLSVDCAPRAAQASARAADAGRMAADARTVTEGSRAQEIDIARQRVVAAEAARSDAADRLTQARALVDDGFISRRELAARENALAEREAALAAALAERSLALAGPRASERAAALASARAAAAEAEAAAALADQCALRSPVDGEVLQIFRREGEFSGASQGTTLIAIADLSRLIVRAEVGERDAARIAVGQRADIWIEGRRERWQGRVTTMARIMGRRSARSLDPTDRFDRDVREAFVEIEGDGPPAVVGLRVLVGFRP